MVFEVNGVAFEVGPGVPSPTEGSRLLAGATEIRPGESVLDLGTGSGVQAVTAALRGGNVVATDVLPECLECARENARRHGVSDRIEFRLGGMFEPVKNEVFDVILALPPQMPALKSDGLDVRNEAGSKGRSLLEQVVKQSPSHLRPGGRLYLLQLAFHGVQRTLEQLRSAGLHPEVVAEKASLSQHAGERLHVLQSLDMMDGVLQEDKQVWVKRVVIKAMKGQ